MATPEQVERYLPAPQKRVTGLGQRLRVEWRRMKASELQFVPWIVLAAIVFGSGFIRLPDMAKAGMLLNIVLVPIIVGLVWLIGRFVFDIELGVAPSWIAPK